MSIYKTKTFARYARDEHIPDRSLVEAIARVSNGLVDADLTGGLIKQRVAREGQGRRGGYRVLVAFRSREFSVFLYGFAKSEREQFRSEGIARDAHRCRSMVEGVPGSDPASP